MKKINIGIFNFIASKKMLNIYSTTGSLNEVTDLVLKLSDVIKESSLLETEFKIFNNLKNKYIVDENSATRYIDNNIKLMEVYTLKEINLEHEKLKEFINEDVDLSDCDLNLYVAIDNLICESLKNTVDVDVDIIDESYNVVLSHIKTNKPKENIISENTELIDDYVIESAIDKFNEKYELIEEQDRILLNRLIKSTDVEKKSMLNEIKSENLDILKNVTKNEENNEKIDKAIKKLNEMVYIENTVIDDILSLHELKKALL